jgi:hypothetical protein
VTVYSGDIGYTFHNQGFEGERLGAEAGHELTFKLDYSLGQGRAARAADEIVNYLTVGTA